MKLEMPKRINCDVQVGIRMTKEDKARLDKLVKKYGTSQGEVIRAALRLVE